jgi:LPXTG-motif cell wall-anchored protein
MKKIAVLLLAVPTSLSLVGTAQATPTSPARCHVNVSVGAATAENPWSIHYWVDPDCTTPTVVSLQAWKTESIYGIPYATQVLISTLYTGDIQPANQPDLVVPQLGAIQPADTNELTGCFVQIDLAYGPPKTNLEEAYGSNLIGAWHFGSQNCVNPPTVTPSVTPSTSVTVSPPVPSYTPATSVPVPSSTPSATAAVPAASTPVTGTPSVSPSPYASLVPPKVVTKPTHKASRKPTKKPTHKPHVKPTKKPTQSTPSTVSEHKPTPAPKVLPYTGSNTVPFSVTGLALIIGGAALKLTSRR